MTKTRTIISALALSFALTSVAACKSEIDDKPEAKVKDPAPKADKDDKAEGGEAQPDGDAAAAQALTLDAGKSKVEFIGAKVTGDHKGNFETIEGTANIEGGKLTAMTVIIDVNSMTTDNEKLTGHLKSPDFFDAPNHPKAKFELVRVTEKAADGATHEIVGNLEMRGVTKEITVPATVAMEGGGLQGKAEFKINRKDWEINFAGKPDDLIKDDVALILDLNFVAKA